MRWWCRATEQVWSWVQRKAVKQAGAQKKPPPWEGTRQGRRNEKYEWVALHCEGCGAGGGACKACRAGLAIHPAAIRGAVLQADGRSWTALHASPASQQRIAGSQGCRSGQSWATGSLFAGFSRRAGLQGQYAPRRSWYRRMESRTNSRILTCRGRGGVEAELG